MFANWQKYGFIGKHQRKRKVKRNKKRSDNGSGAIN